MQMVCGEHGPVGIATAAEIDFVNAFGAKPVGTANRSKTAKYPTTVSAAGAVQLRDIAEPLNKTMPAILQKAGVGQSNEETNILRLPGGNNATNNSNILTYNSSNILPSNTSSRVFGQTAGAGQALTSIQESSEFLGTVGSPMSGAGGGANSRGALLSGQSRPAQDSRGYLQSSDSRALSGMQSGGSAGAATTYGHSYTLIVRLSGQIFSEETLQTILYERAHAAERESLMLMNRFVLPTPGKQLFIPPIEKRFFDTAFMNEQMKQRSKSKVNISFIKGRDAELRAVSYLVMEKLLQCAVSQQPVVECLRETLLQRSRRVVPLRKRPSLLPFTEHSSDSTSEHTAAGVTGVYFRELSPAPALHHLLIREVKLRGAVSKTFASFQQFLQPADSKSYFCDPAAPADPWRLRETEAAACDEQFFSITPVELKQMLKEWNLYRHPSFRETVKDLDAM